MAGEYERNRLGIPKTVRLWGRSLLLLSVLSACSSVPDAVNPVEWYKGTRDFITGKDEPAPPAKGESREARPAVAAENRATAENRKDTPKGLVADRGNAQYAEPIRREVTPTRPLARRAPAAAPQVAAAPTAEPAPAAAIQAAPLAPAQTPAQPAPPTDPQTAMARADQGPSAPVAMDMTPPPPADIPETVAVPGRPKRLQQQFEKRLAESAQQVVRPGIVDMPQAQGQSRLAYADEAPIHLVPPGSGTKSKVRGGGGKGLAAPLPEPQPAATFQVAALQFAGGETLDRADMAAIAEVARLYKQTKGVVRIIGYAPPPSFGGFDPASGLMDGLAASQARAEAAARALTRRGVPAAKILVAADPGYATSGQGGAQIFLDVM